MWRDLALIALFLVTIGPLALWWAVLAISAVADPKGYFERAYGRLQACFDGIEYSETPTEGYVPIDYSVWIVAWLQGVTERIQFYVHRRDAAKLLRRLWWCTIRHTTFNRFSGFYWIGATYWYMVERVKLLRK
jgi:hypothetical protein